MYTTNTTIRRKDTSLSESSKGSRRSDDSHQSHSTAPSSLYDSPRPSSHYGRSEVVYGSPDYDLSPSAVCYPRSSTETYASTTASQEDLTEEPEPYDPEYQVQESPEIYHANLVPSTPSDFADYFPSTRRLLIRHDDTTYDGNMNLRVDTRTGTAAHPVDVRLFHLRMHDLKKREFSLRRYERSSGREVCHSSRKYSKPVHEGRPNIQRSVSNALSSIMGKPEFKRSNSAASARSSRSGKVPKGPKRQDSGYASHEEDDDADVLAEQLKDTSLQIPTNTTKLEFSNYAQVEVKRRGAKSSKRYEFEYWGHEYEWKRVVEREGDSKTISYHLIRDEAGPAVAQILPDIRSPSQVRADEAAGNWVPPMSMWICDSSILEASSDVADVIVSTGLIALVDDCIKRHFHKHKKHVRQVGVPLTPLKVDMEFVSPKVMVEHMFRRRSSGASTKEKGHKGSPLKNGNAVEAF
ncbi:hypothetical protein F5884DRAFT_389620 [Xylogone sp. PMI_703]|nr:hypothetical protein F5884DRAFT_389620 [Xylogone sp. PMI_703]